MKHLSSAFDPAGKLFLGLGNPTEAYEHTYHNIGAMALLFLSGTTPKGFMRPSRKHFLFVEPGAGQRFGLGLGRPNLGPVFALSETFMNESGIAAREALAYFKKDAQQLVVVHDDSDMAVGTYKLTYNQRSAGHHGIDSIITHLSTAEFFRLKIGVRPQKERVRKKADEFVLKSITPTHKRLFDETFERIRQSVFPE
ncbi:hypothetical protein A2755_00840 [Candidatus Wolfebacteria bacterium RIFCSPHIGHO2_01_FULL_48_22]|uniref:Peptidyl-tRNA hydrolase n=2 Tax=Candidatus Wolfeibacteriota TaxID=1752735 RepID=A0A1F8DU13_9BACT|nr:MAG: hypothetical protein A2755_00840 [Candidatus Wolfebacteria bacterium RIFCSPHIGHO2_01_FULL_48_22]OGM93561.1 MAG: hypothetical protein A2935_02955 [Candidatus Wolfebacteria bacterium RIFCSPLOWO2_01_FULL_47_17b]